MDWEKAYMEKTCSPEEAVAENIKNGDVIFVGGVTVATTTLNAMLDQIKSGALSRIVMHGTNILGEVSVNDAGLTEDQFRYRSFFCGRRERDAMLTKTAAYIPTQFGKHSRYIESINPDVAIVLMTPPDKRGFCNIGPTGFNPAAIRSAGKVIAQISKNVPRVYGTCHDYHISQIDVFVIADEPMGIIPEAAPTDLDEKIAAIIVDRIHDGACIQLGIGSMANAVGYGLKEKRHLGIHSEMFTSSMIKLIEAGAVDNSRKSLLPGVSVIGFVQGTRELQEYVSDNPGILFVPFDYVINTQNIAANDNAVSINSAVSVDLTGQVCAESIGLRHFSGTGGQVDFVRGATMSKGGQSFIAMTSVANTKNGPKSRIVLNLEPGSTVTTLRTDVQHIVTEYGCVNLQFCDIPTRVKKMISIAHPDYREELTFQAKQAGLLY